MQLKTVKQILTKANIEQAGHSIQSHWVRKSMPGNKTDQPSVTFTVSWRNAINLEQIKRNAEHFLSNNNSLCAYIYPDNAATEENIDTVKSLLLNTGFKQVEVVQKHN